MTKEIRGEGWNLENSYSHLPKSFFSTLDQNPVNSPKMAIFNNKLAMSLGLDAKEMTSESGLNILAGNKVPEGGLSLAQAYAGHQFGNFTMLGDGRAMLLGEQITPKSERVDVQLKGSGRTPYSRGGDGRAALGPMLREYIISEAMHALGIPTTQSLAVVTTGETIRRETELPGAILTRIAASHLRVGTFQYAAGLGDVEELRALADYTINRHFPDIENKNNRYQLLLQEVIERQAKLVANWQLVGFIHGVMNTDNMTISGETIDYGPCAFMDTYDPATVFSSIDVQGRYAYGNQPYMAKWNLTRLAETLLPLLDENQEKAIDVAEVALSEFPTQYFANWLSGMRAKLGIFNEEEEDQSLIEEFLQMLQKYQADFTNTFRDLSFDKKDGSDLFESPEFSLWYDKWMARLCRQEESKASSKELMQNSNPAVIPRNHRVEEALEAAVNLEDYSLVEQLLAVLSNPYAHSAEQKKYATPPEPTNQPYQTFCGT
ncbi:protein adenylyltransferase SelO [Virgibacillus flavescens]|uniref:protein adenylyltransferase SelO n=1 Tax=Virgibacillus flavescens TaxID=1611422 RepID=UPI003D340143